MKIQIKVHARRAARLQILLNFLYPQGSCLIKPTSIKNIWVIECQSSSIFEAVLGMIKQRKIVKVLDVIRDGEKE